MKTNRLYKANSAVVQIGRLLYVQRVAEAKEAKAAKRRGFRPTKRSHGRISLARW